MGYYMTQRENSFFIAAKDKDSALQAIKNLAGKETISDGSRKHFSWVDPDFVEAKTLEEAMFSWRWNVEEEDGDIIGLQFEGEKFGDDLILFQAIAPYVKKCSYIEMSGEDGCLWRWVFDGKTCKEAKSEITWHVDSAPQKPLYKSTIVIWSEFDPSAMEIEDLVRESTNGEAYCSRWGSKKVEQPENDPDWDGTEFFD